MSGFDLPPSRLPQVGTTIFSVMSALAQQHHAVNLGQGFPDFECDPRLVDAVHQAMRSGANQYPPMPGVLALREAVSRKTEALYGAHYHPDTEVTITAGATQALLTALLALVHPGDEVVVLEPHYDSYGPSIALAGGVARPVALTPGTYAPDFDALRKALGPRTRAVMVNTPHNPSGTTWTPAQWQTLAQCLAPTSAVLISDEVYEHMVFDGQRHHSACELPELRERSLVVSSFGKTFHVTGWKVGSVCAPALLMREFRKVHQFNVFTVNTPMQVGLAQHLQHADTYLGLSAFYQAKRDHFLQGLEGTGLRPLPCTGSYFQCVDIRGLTPLGDADFCRWLTTEVGVAAIPMSAFYANGHDLGVVRFCFAKREDTLNRALEALHTLPKREPPHAHA